MKIKTRIEVGDKVMWRYIPHTVKNVNWSRGLLLIRYFSMFGSTDAWVPASEVRLVQ